MGLSLFFCKFHLVDPSVFITLTWLTECSVTV